MKVQKTLGKMILAVCLGALAFTSRLAAQEIPEAGSGKVKVETRFYSADNVFSASSFSSDTFSSKSKVSGTMTKLVAEYGLGGKWALMFRMRFASLQKEKKGTTSNAFGFQDQTIGLERGLRQGGAFSDAVDFKVIVPTGPTTSIPQLGTGHWAVEPDYQLGFEHTLGDRFLYGTFSVGPRVFPDSGATQLRSAAEVGGRLFSKVNTFGILFLSRTLEGEEAGIAGGPPNSSELYDLLRVGGGIEFAGWKSLRPMVAYETDVAGQGIHAGSRIVFGVTLHFSPLRRQ